MTPTEPGPDRGVDAAGPPAGPSSSPPGTHGTHQLPVIASSDVPAMGEE